MLTYSDNPEARNLPRPEPGDYVHLHASDSWDYTVRVLVHKIEGNNILGKIEAIFDKQGSVEVTGGEVLSNIGHHIAVPMTKVFRILKKTS